jgi:L-seryl-tRNA(Ser) seleniumtransferase
MELEARLRAWDPPIVARIEHDRLVLDLRTVLPEQDTTLTQALSALSG